MCPRGCGNEKQAGRGYCRPCERKRDKDYRAKLGFRGKRNQHLNNRYGITLDTYEKMLEAQHGVCALCNGALNDRKLLSVDHDHATARVRGLLCTRCNAAVGVVDDVPEWLARTAAYLGGDANILGA